MKVRFWERLDTLAHRLKYKNRRWVCAKLNEAQAESDERVATESERRYTGTTTA